MSDPLYSVAVRKLLPRSVFISAASAAALFPAASSAMQGSVAAPTGASCEMELGDKKAGRGQLDAPDLSQARLRCGADTYDVGPAKKVTGAFHQKSGNRLMLVDTPAGEKLVIFRKPSAKSTGKEKRFGQYEVVEQDMRRAIVSLKAFEERGDVVIWRRGGP